MKRTLGAICLVVAAAGFVWWWQSGTRSEPETPESPSEPATEPTTSPVLRGTVTDPSGDPVQDATVVVSQEEMRREASTDAEGEFAFRNLASGNYKLDVRADGYIPPGPPPVRRVEIRVPEPSNDGTPKTLKLTVHRAASISGRVVAGSEPLEDASISVGYAHPNGFRGGADPYVRRGLTRTGPEGSFKLDAVPPGRLRVIAESRDHGSRRSRELLVASGDAIDSLVIDLEPRGAVAGKVVGKKGTPLSARLTLAGEPLESARSVRASGEGNFSIDALPAGDYRLTARADGYRIRTYEVSVERNGTTNRAVTLQPGEGLFGRVVGPEGSPVGGALVRLRNDNRTLWRRTSGNGRFQWRQAPDQQWSARAFSPQYARSPSKTARPGEAVELGLGDAGYIEGRVIAPDGAPVDGAKVGVTGILVDGPQPYGSGAAGVERVENGDGTFRFGPLRPGRYRLEAKKSGYATATSPQVVVEAGESTRQIDIRLGLGGRINGVVRSKKTGKPVPGAKVSTYDMSSAFDSRQTTTDERGRYTLEKVPSGRRSLRIRDSDHLTRVVSGLEVPAGGTVQLDIELRRNKKGEDFAFRGIGASLQRTDRGVIINRVLPGGGAKESGLERGDFIRSVDRQPVDDLPLSRVIQKIRGRAGESVQLTVEREGRGKFQVEIERGRVVVKDRGGQN